MLVTPVVAVLIGFVGVLTLLSGVFLVQCGVARVTARRPDIR